MADFFNDRRPVASADGDAETPVNRQTLRGVNARIRTATPDYRRNDVDRKIRTAAVQRHRARRAGQEDYKSAADYVSFITGSSNER